MGRVVGGFQDQMTRRLIWRLPRRQVDGKWDYTLTAMARAEAGFEMMEEYIWRRQNMVAQYIATR